MLGAGGLTTLFVETELEDEFILLNERVEGRSARRSSKSSTLDVLVTVGSV